MELLMTIPLLSALFHRPTQLEVYETLRHKQACDWLTETERKQLHGLECKLSNQPRMNEINAAQREIIGRLVRQESLPDDKRRLDRLSEEWSARFAPRAHRAIQSRQNLRRTLAEARR
jgi:hypothetical protein